MAVSRKERMNEDPRFSSRSLACRRQSGKAAVGIIAGAYDGFVSPNAESVGTSWTRHPRGSYLTSLKKQASISGDLQQICD
jgi:hypothetical protein